jgi:hypothetical protein
MESYDAVAIYALKAKIFYTAGCIPQDFFAAFRSIVPHIEYPLLLPLSEAWFYTFFGTLDDLLVKAAFPLYYLSILAIFYFAIRRFLSRRSAMLFTFLLASVPQFGEYATNGYADLPLAVNYSAGFFYLYLWVTERREPYMWLSLLFSVLSLWTKTEALMLSCVSLAAVVLYFLSEKKPLPKGGMIYISVLALAAASLVTLTGLSGLGVHGDFKGSFRADRLLDLKRIPMILYEYQRQFFGPKKWNMAWIVLILALVLRFRMVFSGRLKFVTMALALVFCGYAAIYMMLPGDISWHLSTTASRFFIHFLPIVFLWLALIFKEEALDA